MYGPVSQPGTFSRFPGYRILIKDMLEGPNPLDLREGNFIPPIHSGRAAIARWLIFVLQRDVLLFKIEIAVPSLELHRHAIYQNNHKTNLLKYGYIIAALLF